MQLIFFASIISASGQSFSNYEIIKLININVLQIDIPSIENSNNNDLGDWIVSEGNASLVVQDGNRNHTSIEQISGIGNVAKALQQAHNKQTGHEYSGKRECVIYQLKSINYTEIKQYGNQNRSETLQNGNSNEINIVQHGGRSFFIEIGRASCRERV